MLLMFDFCCAECGTRQERLLKPVEAQTVELVCTACGGAMRRAPARVSGLKKAPGQRAASAATSAACNHRYACRCGGVNLTRPNPFREQLLEAQAKPQQD